MKMQFQILLFIACLNIATGLVIALFLPGTEYVLALNATGSVEEYEDNFNATNIAKAWSQTPFSGIPFIGDIFAGFSFLVTGFTFLIDGFPTFLNWMADTYIATEEFSVFDILANALRAIYAILMAMFMIEFISGRNITD